MADFDKELRELIWYELGDGLNATDVNEAVESIKRLVVSRKELEEAIGDDEVPVIPVNDYHWRIRNEYRQTLRAKLLPPTKGGNDVI